jgi:hypothetical protein
LPFAAQLVVTSAKLFMKLHRADVADFARDISALPFRQTFSIPLKPIAAPCVQLDAALNLIG